MRTFTEELARADVGHADLTVEALLSEKAGRGEARVLAVVPGVVAGLQEIRWFYTQRGLRVETKKADGEAIKPGDEILLVEGDQRTLLSVERVGLNLLQRMSGIATATLHLQGRAHRQSPGTFVVATRKTPWGLLDKRAVHLGGGGTHRLGLWDAILIKTNHLKLLGASEEAAIPLALKRAWTVRRGAAFLEVEATGINGALAAARVFRELQQAQADAPPCLIMLDNVAPEEIARVIKALQDHGLYDEALIEASGQISEATIEAYAATKVDAISIGAITHSAQALDLRQRLR